MAGSLSHAANLPEDTFFFAFVVSSPRRWDKIAAEKLGNRLFIDSLAEEDRSLEYSVCSISNSLHHRYFQHAHFIPIVGVGKRGEY